MCSKIERTEFKVYPFHTDFQGKLSMSVLGNHLLNCSENHAVNRGFGEMAKNGTVYRWVLSRLVIEMFEMPKNGDKFFIDTWISNVYLYFTDRNYRITDSEGKAIGYAKAVWAMIDQADRKQKDLHELHGTTIDQYIDEETECPIAKASRVKPLAEDTYTKSIDTEYSDIDLNGHVNSIKYIEHILNLFNLEHYKQMSVKRFEIAYMAESYYGDVLRLYLRDNANGTFDAEAQKDSHDDAKNTVLVRCSIKFE